MKDINVLIKASDDYTNGNDNTNTNESKYKVISNLIMQLRKCCLHPFLFPGGEANVEETSLEELIASSGKLAVLDKMLRSMYQNKNRTVIFSQFTSMLDILEDYCTMRGWKFCRFDGSTPRAQRNYKINQFNAPDSEYFIFLMSTRSGGLGINLQTADTCILYDSDWNPQPDIQAMARVHRIGQKKVVHVYRLVSSGTVEERVLERAEKKLYLDQMVNRGTSSQTADEHELEGTRLTTSELLSTLKFGSNAIFASKNDLPTDKDIDAVIDRERSEQSSSGLLQGGATKTANDFDIDKELTDTQTFGGIDFRQIRDKMDKEKKGKGPKNLKEEWKDLNMLADSNGGRGMRTKKNRLLNIEDCNGTSRQVLSVNNYDLVEGEPSVFNKETRKTSGMSNPKREKVEITYTHQDFCQYCGDGGKLILCPLCPISVHAECHGMTVGNFFTMPHHRTCPHHRCLVCDKSVVGAGGMLFACECCPACYCEDCLPSETVNYLGETTERLEKLRYDGNPRIIYIHCSEHCVGVAKHDFDWKEPSIEKRWCPEEINVSYAFGSNALSVKDIAKKFAQRREIDTESLHPN
jgi:SWI/SNF-related matrix-associated actin-dependent regulator of chromatin subfamily A member 5